MTDANVVLGYINPGQLAGGNLTLRPELAEDVLNEHVARPLGLSVHQAAYGIHTVVNASMIRAIKSVSTNRGRDPRDFALFAFGGNGAVHAAAIAQEMGIRQVIVPPRTGVLSAVGLLEAASNTISCRRSYTRPRPCRSTGSTPPSPHWSNAPCARWAGAHRATR